MRNTCGALLSDNRGFCGKAPLAGRSRCQFHAGAVPQGELSQLVTNGRYAKNLPTYMRQDYQNSVNDPNQTSCVDAIALCDARIIELSGELDDSSDNGFSWKELSSVANRIMTDADQPSKLAKHLEVFQDMMRQGQNKGLLWQSLSQTLEMRRKIAETETKRLVVMNQTIPATAAVEVLSNLCHAFRRNVLAYAERHVANKILSKASRELSRIIATGGMGVLMSGGGPGMAGSGEEPDVDSIDDLLE